MDLEKFDILLNTILGLFTPKPPNCLYECVAILGGTVAHIDIMDTNIKSAIGNLSNFRAWMQPQLTDFFEGLSEFFHTENKRVNERRRYSYQDLIIQKKCKLLSFKKKFAKEVYLDMLSILGPEFGIYCENTDTLEKRRIIVLNNIKNHVYRLFLINEYCTP